MLIIESQSLDVYRNLAIEEYLMDHVMDKGPVLFLWQSDCAVVMGKNQNPWMECRLDRMEEDLVPLARRISGGGTVYHDAGNLNYCIIVDRIDYNEQQAYDMVIQCLKPMDVAAERTGKSNLSVGGLKFSGNAFCFRGGRAMHHGTLLLQTDLARLGRYLGCLVDGIETHAIPSEPASVMNLDLDRDDVVEALKMGFARSYEADSVTTWEDAAIDPEGLEPLMARQRSADWQYGATPRFSMKRDGGRLEVVKDVIVNASGFAEAEDLLQKRFSELVISRFC